MNKSQATTHLYFRGDLPWDESGADRFRFIALLLLLLSCGAWLTYTIIFTEIPEKQREDAEKIPETLTQFILEKKKQPPAPKPKEEKKEETPPEEKKKEPEDKPKDKPKEKEIIKKKELKKAKTKAKKLAKVFDALSELREPAPIINHNKTLSSGGEKAAVITRDILTSRAAKGSGGIVTAKMSTGGGGGSSLGATSSQQVSSNIEATAGTNTGRVVKDSSGKSQRSNEQMRKVFSRYQGALHAIYRRGLREDPSMEGTVVLQMTIAPSGEVIECEIKSSQLDSAEIEEKIIKRVKLIDFGELPVEPWVGTYPFNFFPS